jgi:hypothetical protein
MERAETMKTIQYLVRISRDPHTDWGASVPDLPGCVATGKTLDSALRRIEQAMATDTRPRWPWPITQLAKLANLRQYTP